MPTNRTDQSPDPLNPDIAATMSTDTGTTSGAYGRGQRDYASGDTALETSADYWDDKKGPGPKVMSADTLQGDSVMNEAGDDLGEITDIMIDVPTGRVAYAVLSVGGLFGIGDKLFAVPWTALRLDPENKCFRLDVAKERLDQAPGFDKDHWPSMADQRWAEEIHAYYHARPYWS